MSLTCSESITSIFHHCWLAAMLITTFSGLVSGLKVYNSLAMAIYFYIVVCWLHTYVLCMYVPVGDFSLSIPVILKALISNLLSIALNFDLLLIPMNSLLIVLDFNSIVLVLNISAEATTIQWQ